ncbi:MAG TPA: hypothetical protein VFI08_14040 [Spirochaetia bacterium]|nr:hypothetical protein [Spirochaetia bacterium]
MRGRARSAAWLLSVCVTLAAGAPRAAALPPAIGSGDIELQSRAQLVANLGSWDILAEVRGKLPDEDVPRRPQAYATVGTYYRVVPNLKVGVLAGVQAGVRHDDDVLPTSVPTGDFVWNDSSNRAEGILMLDASPRFQLGFLPTGNWVFEVKNRFVYNAWNHQASVMTRPELTWFWIRDRDPFLNLSAGWEVWFPLNFGTTAVYQNYPWVTALWHATPEIGIELTGGYKTTVWSTSSAWRAAGGATYSLPVTSWLVSVGVVYTPSF